MRNYTYENDNDETANMRKNITFYEERLMKMNNSLKTIKVVAAVICDSFDQKNKIFATARGYGEFKGRWEFPGGKIESGETPQQALIREIKEELDVEIVVGDLIKTIEYDYPTFHLSMDCFWCTIAEGQIILKEAQAAKWLNKCDLDTVNWLPADLLVVEALRKELTLWKTQQ